MPRDGGPPLFEGFDLSGCLRVEIVTVGIREARQVARRSTRSWRGAETLRRDRPRGHARHQLQHLREDGGVARVEACGEVRPRR